jgi:hypothetical protein
VNEITRCCRRFNTANQTLAVSFCVLSMKNCGGSLRRKMAREKPGHTLQPTALVHEAWLRLVDADGKAHFENRSHFFSVAAEAMRCCSSMPPGASSPLATAAGNNARTLMGSRSRPRIR